MAEIIHDSFEWLQQSGLAARGAALPKWDEGFPNYGSAIIPPRGHHTAGGHFSSYGGQDYLEKAVASRTRIFTGAATHVDQIGATLPGVRVWGCCYNGTTRLLTITTEPDWSIGLRSGGYNGTLLAKTDANSLSHGLSWQFLEFEIVKSATVGVWRVWAGETSPIGVFTGLNTGADVITKFRIGETNVPSGVFDPTYHVNLTDFYLIDDVAGNGPVARVGDSEMLARFPNAAGAFSDFTPSAGSNWQNVDDRPHDSDATRNTSSTVGHKDRYGFENLPDGFDARVISVTHGYLLKKDDAGARTATGVIRGAGGVEVQDVSRTLTTEYQGFAHTIWTDPDTGDALLDNPDIVAIANGLQAGPEVLT